MQRRTTTRLIAAVTALLLLGPTAGCDNWLGVSSFASAGAGWLLRDLTTPTTTETRCYRNNELIDCSEMPGLE